MDALRKAGGWRLAAGGGLRWASAAPLAVAALLGCQSLIPHIDPAAPAFAGRSGDELRDLALGRRVYIAKCSGCHSLYPPARGDRGYWEHWVKTMAPRSKLTPEDRERIQGYLFAVSSDAPLNFTRR